MGADYIVETSATELDDAASDALFAKKQRQKLFTNSTGIKLSSVAKMMCNGVALFASLSDTKLLICRGYIVFPKETMFMEHWWAQVGNTGTIFDPLTDLMFGSTKLDRLAIDKLSPKSFEAIGSFDCNAMVGACERRANNLPDCEWCVARYSIERQGPYKAYELSFNGAITHRCITDVQNEKHKRNEAKQQRYQKQYDEIAWWMSGEKWWNDLQSLTKQRNWYEHCCHNYDVRDISIKVVADRIDELTEINDEESRKDGTKTSS